MKIKRCRMINMKIHKCTNERQGLIRLISLVTKHCRQVFILETGNVNFNTQKETSETL